ncbi:conserved Plasmodium protein, unknown function [Plasmodium knowlesi strain H]|uniref:Uncharacterized protein n=3 Tax=Plasmodium knowlesi TaxID=5850 RepID=A0A1A7VVL7_PLAKH|nr:conserved Plasmodium protein, unknown function [Plasmodium knowlesi strain H]OTN68353.1 Uncharacterized protein PKNOH_S03327700 [Plasmodium knowlesi]CAA9987180.1 conserved Plasmodium protein, unknown function [Plasmodium knowlesi strain H]SBO23940.1 conserved Plasmodium protein, unknown function [Plasmodium knowlesi strain H]SBO25867.1 conserved Plasmodium protein, unknown function [Plasmodium knowlesi strain H]VVS76654.1 conserved Plasmodium protein, unknown function [Plasmodium knowlesi s
MLNGTTAEGTPVQDTGEDMPSNRSKDHNKSCPKQAGDSPKKTDLTETNKMNMLGNGFAAHIAMEALAKASRFISKNERIQKEYSGMGLKNEEDNEDSADHLDAKGHNAHAGGAKIGPNKNLLPGAHPVMPGMDKELQEKLKNRRCDA